MTLYSANNMPYAALGGVMTGDSYERTSLNAYRFVAVNLAQLVVTGFTLPLVAKFAAAYGEGDTARATGWEITMGIWAVVCVVFFLITFATTRERLAPVSAHASSLKQDFADLLRQRTVDRHGDHDADPLRNPLAPRRGVLQLLPLLCRQAGDVRLAGRPGPHRAAARRGSAVTGRALELPRLGCSRRSLRISPGRTWPTWRRA